MNVGPKRTTFSSNLVTVAFAGATLLVACDAGGLKPSYNGVERIPSDDPAVDDRLDQLDIVCETEYTITGTFVPGATEQPSDLNGCWPVGTWTLTASVDQLGCSPQPEFPTDFIYEVTYDEENSAINVAYATDPTNERVNLKISTSGDSLCHGSMEHFGLDHAVWSMHPTLQLDNTLLGSGTYSQYGAEEDPF